MNKNVKCPLNINTKDISAEESIICMYKSKVNISKLPSPDGSFHQYYFVLVLNSSASPKRFAPGAITSTASLMNKIIGVCEVLLTIFQRYYIDLLNIIYNPLASGICILNE